MARQGPARPGALAAPTAISRRWRLERRCVINSGMTTPSEADIYGALTQIFRDVFVREDLPLTPELTGEDIEGWDSFKQVEIILATEEHFRIRMKAREIDALRNVGDFARLVALKVAEINRVGAAASIS